MGNIFISDMDVKMQKYAPHELTVLVLVLCTLLLNVNMLVMMRNWTELLNKTWFGMENPFT